MGEDTVDYFQQITGEKPAPSNSLDMKIHGYTEQLPSGHWQLYGSDAKAIQKLASENSELAEKLHPDFPNIAAEVIWAVRNEMAMKVEDVLSRRIRILILDAQAAIDSAEKVAQIMAKELKKDETWISKEIQDFNKVAEKYLIKK